MASRTRKTLAQDLAEIAESARREQAAEVNVKASAYYHGSVLPFLRRNASDGRRRTMVGGSETVAIARRVVELLEADGFVAQQRHADSPDIEVKW